MKEMSIEEKAKAYDIALDKIERLLGIGDNCSRKELENIFPELKDSEDERIRKELIQYFKNFTLNTFAGLDPQKILFWLEKQGQTFTQKDVDDAYKIEPKFREGEWIANGDYTWKIVGVRPLDYILQSQDGNIVDDTISYVDEQFHSFTIEDAKEGDVLTYNDSRNNVWVCIFKEYANGKVYDYCTLDNEFFSEHGNWNYLASFNYVPATKEQRDLLFQKMKEAGYEWDAEKKELKKIEQPKLTEFEDAIKDMMDDYRDAIDDNDATVEEVKEKAAYLLSLISCKSAWSEEDLYMQKQAIKCVNNSGKLEVSTEEIEDWLKSLNPKH